MQLETKVLYILLSLIVVVSFQNCGQPGSLGLQTQDLGKLATTTNTDLVDVSDDNTGDNSDVQIPPTSDDPAGTTPVVVTPVVNPPTTNPPDTHPPVVIANPPTDDDTNDIVDADDDGNIIGKNVSCADLAKIKVSLLPASNTTDIVNTRGLIKVENKDQVSVTNHRGVLVLNSINTISKIENVRALLLRASSHSIGQITNVRALSLIDSKTIDTVTNYRGLGCISSNISSITNFRGILEVQGDLKSVRNFRGILKVNGNIDELDNFRGILIVSGNIGSKKNVHIRVQP